MSASPRKEPEIPVPLGQVVAGKYRLDDLIGWGGMGVVVAATHVELGQRVALKFLLPRSLQGDEARQRFLREARAAVRLKSEHVARVFDVGALPTGEPYTVMELLEGSDLAAFAKSNTPIRVSDAVEFVVQACEAIVEAHALGIVHRDLKPHNLFVTRRVNGSPLVKVLDFGISKEIAPYDGGDLALTDSTVVLGSPLYMAPEQMKSAKNADARSDIWSLGVILYELLTGKVPFDGDSMTELCLKVVNDPPPPPRELRGDLPEDLAAIVLRCLEKDPTKRFPNVATLAEELEVFATSSRQGSGERAWRSLVDTADAQEFGTPASPLVSSIQPAAPHARTDVTWGDAVRASAPPASGRGRKRVFLGGLTAGIGATALLGGLLFFALRTHPAPSADVAAAAPPSAAPLAPASPREPSSVAPARIPTPTPSASTTAAAPPSGSASATPDASHAGAARAASHAKKGATPPHAASKPPSAKSVATEPTTAATPAANGAPILH